MDVLLGLGAVLAGGLIAARVGAWLRLPAVTGYLLVGLIIGPIMLDVVGEGVLAQFAPFNQFTLSFIALGIGRDLDLVYLRQLGPSVIYLAILQALVPFTLVFSALILLGTSLPLALVLAAIATATAPALTVAVMQELRSDGPLTRTHLVVVGLDDVMAILTFGFVLPLAQVMAQGQWQWQWLTGVGSAVWHVAGSLLLAAVGGLLFVLVAGRLRGVSELVVALVALIALLSGLAGRWGFSPLLAALVAGTTIGNRFRHDRALNRVMETIAPLLLIAFFVLAGASLEPQALWRAGQVGILYIVLRGMGKVVAVYVGAWWMPMTPITRKWLGLTLMPQAGVAVGMVVMARTFLPQFADEIGTVILGAVFFYELVGPSLTRLAVIKAGEQEKMQN